ncbi:hypothetical protein C8Q75DRAFT_730701 [Abortiporus biennis]|nr:hypothetical protein C8Q75DRAFT_730701 [Abortiporus biennis]
MSTIAIPKLDDTMGAAFIGMVICSMYKSDSRTMRVLVFILWLLDTLQLILVAHMVYYYVVTNYFNPKALVQIVWSFPAETIVTTTGDCIIRGILIYRIWILTKSYWITGGIITLTLFVPAITIVLVVRVFQLGTLPNLHKARYMKKRTGFKQTDSVLSILMRYAIHTALLTSVLAIASMITFLVKPNTMIFVAFFVILPKFFLNSVLATLNARDDLREKFQKENSASIQLSKINVITSTSMSSSSNPSATRQTHLSTSEKMFGVGGIHVEREHNMTRDPDAPSELTFDIKGSTLPESSFV